MLITTLLVLAIFGAAHGEAQPNSGAEECPSCLHTIDVQGEDHLAPYSPEAAAATLRVPGQPPPVSGHRQVLLEIYSGAWCGACPGAEVERELLSATRTDHFVVVEHHYGYGASTADQMEIEDDGDQDTETLLYDFALFGFPAGMLDRTHDWTSRQDWKSVLDQRRYVTTPLELSFSSTYEPSSRVATVTVNATFVQTTSGDTRLNCMLTEDMVIGNGPGWDQVSNYNDTAGHPYYQAGNPIAGFVHRFVARAFLDGLYGSPGIVPDPAVLGQTYSTVFEHTLDPAIDANRAAFVCYAAKEGTAAGEREVYDAASAPLGSASPEPPLIWDYLESANFSRWSAIVD